MENHMRRQHNRVSWRLSPL